MAIEITLDVDKHLTELAGELRDFYPKRILRGISRKVFPPVERQLDAAIKRDLQQEPGAVQHPFVWSRDPKKNARARRWFFANYPDGYKRTRKLKQAWTGAVTLKAEAITVSIANPADASGYVYGDEAHGYQQVPGHETTGWLNAGEVVPGVLLDTTLELEKQLDALLLEELDRL